MAKVTSGTRYSIVTYAKAVLPAFVPETREAVRAMGFPVPDVVPSRLVVSGCVVSQARWQCGVGVAHG